MLETPEMAPWTKGIVKHIYKSHGCLHYRLLVVSPVHEKAIECAVACTPAKSVPGKKHSILNSSSKMSSRRWQ